MKIVTGTQVTVMYGPAGKVWELRVDYHTKAMPKMLILGQRAVTLTYGAKLVEETLRAALEVLCPDTVDKEEILRKLMEQ